MLDAISTRVFRLGDAPGEGSRMKLVNQHLAGVHIAAAAEALVLAIGMGLDPHRVIETIRDCAGTSWMFENRGPHIADGDYRPLSAVDIFVKDLGIVLEESARQGLDPVLAASALDQFQRAAAAGWGRNDDSAVAKIYAARRRHRAAGEGRGMILGAIGDDFTGSSDLALMLAKGGMRTVQYVGVPDAPGRGRGAGRRRRAEVALGPRRRGGARCRSQALDWLRAQGCSQFYFKYCSTFDSTPEGNIGPVIDALIDALGAEAPVLVCPAFPAAGRTVFQGHLFVGDRLLSESGMEKHPLTPMTDPDLRRWLGLQTARPDRTSAARRRCAATPGRRCWPKPPRGGRWSSPTRSRTPTCCGSPKRRRASSC